MLAVTERLGQLGADGRSGLELTITFKGRKGGRESNPQDCGPNFTPKASPCPNSSPHRISNRQ